MGEGCFLSGLAPAVLLSSLQCAGGHRCSPPHTTRMQQDSNLIFKVYVSTQSAVACLLGDGSGLRIQGIKPQPITNASQFIKETLQAPTRHQEPQASVRARGESL